MFNDDEDYGFLTGGLGDLDGDGRVDFAEYLNEEYEYQQIMGNKDNDDDFSISDDDDDWEFSYIDTAAEYGLSPYDYADKEEFIEALAKPAIRLWSLFWTISNLFSLNNIKYSVSTTLLFIK